MCNCNFPLKSQTTNISVIYFQHMLRQGRAAVQVCHELEVITIEYLQDASCDGKRGAFPPINVYTTVKGILHLRLGNVGKPSRVAGMS